MPFLAALLLFGGVSAVAQAPREPTLTIDDVGITYGAAKGYEAKVTRITVRGTTDLPDGTLLIARMIFLPYKFAFLSEPRGMARGGRFEIVMGPYARPLLPDRYGVSVSFFPQRQPRQLRERLAPLAAVKRQRIHVHRPAQIAASRMTTGRQTAAVLNTLRQLAGQMSGWIVQLRAMDQRKALPTGDALARWTKQGNLWDLRYDTTRKANDERHDQALILPYLRTEQTMLKAVNLLMDFQYEYRNLLTRNRDFPLKRSLDQLSLVLVEAGSWFRFESVALASDPGAAVRREIQTQVQELTQRAAGPEPSPEALRASLDRGRPTAGDGRRLALYRELLAWRKRLEALEPPGGAPAEGDDWVGRANDWLMSLRQADQELSRTLTRELESVPGAGRAIRQLSLAALHRLVARLTADRRIAALELPDPGTDEALTAAFVRRFDLATVHTRAIRYQYDRLADLAGELARRGMEALGPDHGRHEWEQWAAVYDTQLLRQAIFELPAVGPLSPEATRGFEAGKAELTLAVTHLMKLKVDLEEALAQDDARARVLGVAARVGQLGRSARTKAEEKR